MKRIFLAFLLLTGVSNSVLAQSAPAPKLMFASRVNELDAALSRNRPELAAQAYADLASSMQQRIVALRSTDVTKANQAQKLYTDIKQQSADMQRSRTVLITSLRSFLELY
jgi:uncharacterized membrane protein YgcG